MLVSVRTVQKYSNTSNQPGLAGSREWMASIKNMFRVGQLIVAAWPNQPFNPTRCGMPSFAPPFRFASNAATPQCASQLKRKPGTSYDATVVPEKKCASRKHDGTRGPVQRLFRLLNLREGCSSRCNFNENLRITFCDLQQLPGSAGWFPATLFPLFQRAF